MSVSVKELEVILKHDCQRAAKKSEKIPCGINSAVEAGLALMETCPWVVLAVLH